MHRNLLWNNLILNKKNMTRLLYRFIRAKKIGLLKCAPPLSSPAVFTKSNTLITLFPELKIHLIGKIWWCEISHKWTFKGFSANGIFTEISVLDDKEFIFLRKLMFHRLIFTILLKTLIMILFQHNWLIGPERVGCSPMIWETWVQSQVTSYQRL